jgi:Ca2+-binding RTX toxin-like protein
VAAHDDRAQERRRGNRRRTRALALAGALAAGALLAAPAAADAATVRINGFVGQFAFVRSVAFTAAPGESNHATLTSDGNDLVIHDDGALVSAGSGCNQRDEHTATCPAADIDDVDLDAGDGNDSLATTLASARTRSILHGGAGDDVLDGGPGADRLDGGGGIDTLRGGPGDDELADGDGAHPDGDVLDGGPGVDALSYLDHDAPVFVDLAAGTSAEGDRIAGIDNLTGSRGDDVLAGDSGPNEITGLSGADTIRGDDGDDRLDGGNTRHSSRTPEGLNGDDRLAGDGGNDVLIDTSGANAFDGGPGDDQLMVLSRPADQVSCGDGFDAVEIVPRDAVPEAFGPDAFAGDCELATLDDATHAGTTTLRPAPTLSRSGVVSVHLGCTAGHPCRAHVAVGLPARPFHAFARRTIRLRGPAMARFAGGRRAARRLRAAGRIELSFSDCRECGLLGAWTVPV